MVAPASMAASTTSQRKSSSVRAASSGLNSMSGQQALARRTLATAFSMIWALLIRSLCSRWMADVARKTWIRGCWAYWIASQARSMSRSLHRARPQTDEPVISVAIARTASKSPTEAIGNPASMTSTPSPASARATSSFSAMFMLAPGDCSPSRRVVSKIRTRFARAERSVDCRRGRAHGSALSLVCSG